MTEREALIAITKMVDAIDAADPALTPEQQAYVDREEAFRKGPGAVPPGERYRARVNAFGSTRRLGYGQLNTPEPTRSDLSNVKQLAGRPERFAVWSDIAVRMSFPGGLELALSELHRMGVVDKEALGRAQGLVASWLEGRRSADIVAVLC